ncbi:MAG TPA: DUF1207 domain-containing protein [Gemmatimonadaceae bacterium]|nr:DUF1207 domain-containing protein [Gemmatimonadaceae bacterium]
MRRSTQRCVLLLAAAVAATPPSRASAQDTGGPSYPARCGVGIPRDEQGGYVPLPRGDVFCPLLADPKAAQSFVSYLREGSDAGTPDTSIQIASVGLGDSFGLGRWGGSRPGDGSQLSLMGAIFAQFDLGTASYDLLNSDYVIGLANTVRRGWFSTRLRLYHQSSHLGDELLLREGGAALERENLSFESLELLLSADGGLLRLYGGGEYLFRRAPDDLERYVARGGAELRPAGRVLSLGGLGGFRFVAATDLKASQEQDWDPSVSARAGFEYDRAGPGDTQARRWRLLFEYYRGPSPYGQFFRENVEHIGVGLHFGL